MTRRIYSANDIAAFVLSRVDPQDNDVSNMKLQKLCYYMQGLATAMRGVPLFRDPLYAWDHGPVVPHLYQQYRVNRALPIPAVRTFDDSIFEDADRQALNDIYDYYGQFSAWRLRNMSHADRPWIDAYNRDDKEISVDELVSYFKPQINEEYMKRVYGEEVSQ